MKYLHTMIRVLDLEKTLDFFTNKLGLIETRRKDYENARFSLIFLATEKGAPEVELTYNWDHKERYNSGDNFGHLAYQVENIYDTCQKLLDSGVEILRPPRDGKMAFIKSPDGISVELLQKDGPLEPKSPWSEMTNIGTW
jgi:lactoylglutathione lyase